MIDRLAFHYQTKILVYSCTTILLYQILEIPQYFSYDHDYPYVATSDLFIFVLGYNLTYSGQVID